MFQDLKYAARLLVRKPGFTLIAVAALALGIGANTATFSVVNAVLIRPLPFDEPDRLVNVDQYRRADTTDEGGISYPNFLDCAQQNQVFEEMGVFSSRGFGVTIGTQADHVPGAIVSASAFHLLRARPILGRTFLPEEDLPGKDPVVVISETFWSRYFGRDPEIIGRTLTVEARIYTIVGVLPSSFRFPIEQERPEIWTTLSFVEQFLDQRGAEIMSAIGRLKPNATLDQARVDLAVIADRLAEQYPQSNSGTEFHAVPMHEELVGDVRPALLVLLGAVAFVLLIACANVANLMLARAAARQKEIAIRNALGASRLRLIRQLLIESLLLSALGGTAGLLLAFWGADALLALGPPDLLALGDVRPDTRVIAFTLAVSVLTGLVFGLAPVLQSSKVYLNESLKEGARTASVGHRNRMQQFLVVSEVALAVTLLIGAGLMVRTFIKLGQVDLGFNANDVLTMETFLPRSKYPRSRDWPTFYRQLLERVSALPGVQSAAVATAPPLTGNHLGLGFSIEGRPTAPEDRPTATYRAVSPNAFAILGIQLRSGRLFNDFDTASAPKVLIINETLARRHLPGEDPIGKRVAIGYNRFVCEIVGVVGDLKHESIDSESGPEIYAPFEQTPWWFNHLILRVSGDPSGIVAAVRNEMSTLDRDVPVFDARTLQEYVYQSVSQPRFNMLLLVLFAALAITLAGVGVYGVISYSVAQRTNEIGVRMALGGRPADIVRLVLRQGMVLVLVGAVIGLTAAFALTRLMERLLFGVSATDLLTFAVVPLLPVLVALAACIIPARRAAKVDPIEALRYE